MDFKKIALYIAVALVAVTLYFKWEQDYPPKQAASTTEQTQASANGASQSADNMGPSAYTPPTSAQPSSSIPAGPKAPAASSTQSQQVQTGPQITVQTDVLHASISTKGGNLVVTELPKYPISVKEKNIPVTLFTPTIPYIAQSGLTTAKGLMKPMAFSAAQTHYSLPAGHQELKVTLTGHTATGLHVTKTYLFYRGSYAVKQLVTISNAGSTTWKGSFFGQLLRRNIAVKKGMHSRSFIGGAMLTNDEPYKQLPYAKLAENNVNENVKSGWVAFQQPYFLTAWVPQKDQTYHYYSQSQGDGKDGKDNLFTLGFVSPEFAIAPGQSVMHSSTIYAGPEIASNLEKIAKGLKLTIDYGWLAPISVILFWLLAHIEAIIGNWGWAIVLVTILIKIIFWGLSSKSYRSMAKMRDLAPRIEALKQRYGDDRQAMGKATMELYKKEKVNPMGGCLPMIIQIPVFIALYYVLTESVQLRQAPFIFWIHDLSVRDPYFILPILMGASMLIQQKLSPPPPDPTQAKMMLLLPVVFTVFFATFPAGLVLYWLTNSVVSVLQQWWVMKNCKKNGFDTGKKKKRKQ